jgi:hypothetical protein
MYPLFQNGDGLAVWNMPYLNLECLPILDKARKDDLEWLITHTSLQFSARERKLRDASIKPATGDHKDVRINFKDSLFSMFMHFTGLQGQPARIFGLNNPNAGGVHVLIFISCLRLDIANHTVVLDSAVLPLTNKLMPKLERPLAGLSFKEICNIMVDEDEMRLWKELLPAFTERCRRWEHRPSCEYVSKSKVPLSVENGEPLLCSCGNGILPQKFVPGNSECEPLLKYAVRAAISPTFSVPFVERNFGIDEIMRGLNSASNECRNCQKKSSDGTNLLTCSRCHFAKYCSVQCQRADWKVHKKACTK